MITRWLRRFFRTEERAALQSEVQRRLNEAIERSKQESQALADDRLALAERIRKSTRAGRSLIGGSRPL